MSGKSTRTVVAHEDELDIGQDKQITLDSDKSLADIVAELNEIEPAGTIEFGDQAETLQFMEEEVAVCVFTSTDKNAETVVEVFCNGTPQRFIRGQWQIVKRKYVEVLARAKPFSVTTPEVLDSNGDRTTRIDINNALRYPFEMKDKNPKGAAWLHGILSESR
jgi:hypothetical protein